MPLALVGTFALMYVAGFSLDNLSLMGLSIAVGFVVDDAIVMLENISAARRGGIEPAPGGAQRLRRNRLYHFLNQPFAGRSVHSAATDGRDRWAHLPRIRHHRDDDDRCFRFRCADVDTGHGCALLAGKNDDHHGRLFMASERVFDAMLDAYRRSLDVALHYRRVTLSVFMLTVCLSGYLFYVIPKGFFPIQDTGLIIGTSEAAQDISFAAMESRQLALGRVVQSDPAVASIAMVAGATGNQTQNNGRMYITLKPIGIRHASALQVIQRLQPKLAKVEGAALFLQPAQDVRVGGRPTRSLFQYTLQDASLDELDQWAPKVLAKMKTLPQLTGVATDQQTGGTTLTLTIDRDQAVRFGIQPQLIDDTLYDAFGEREVTQFFTQVNSYHVIIEVLPALQNSPSTLDQIFIKSPLRGQRCH